MSEINLTVADCFNACSNPGDSIYADGVHIDFFEHQALGIAVGVTREGAGEVLYFDETQTQCRPNLDNEGNLVLVTELEDSKREVRFQFFKRMPLTNSRILSMFFLKQLGRPEVEQGFGHHD